MTIKTLGKNSMGIALALLLVLLLSESRLFKFFTDTYLGRAFLIFIILIASYLNKILGVVCVFIIIIMFSNTSYYEAFGDNGATATSDSTNGTNSTNSTTATNTTNNGSIANNVMEKVKNVKNAISQAVSSQNSTGMTPSTMPAQTMPAQTMTSTSSPASSPSTTIAGSMNTPTSVPSDKINVITSAMQAKNSGNNIEGFDLQTTENNIKRGKQSNSIPVNQFLMQSPNVAPYESANFSENFGVL
jgi:hypothetical protein